MISETVLLLKECMKLNKFILIYLRIKTDSETISLLQKKCSVFAFLSNQRVVDDVMYILNSFVSLWCPTLFIFSNISMYTMFFTTAYIVEFQINPTKMVNFRTYDSLDEKGSISICIQIESHDFECDQIHI